MRRYVATFQDMHSRFALAAGWPAKHARHSTKLWQMARACYPFKPQRVLSDNGSEFKATFTKIVLNGCCALVDLSQVPQDECACPALY
jgi:hypothetical protein